MELPHGFVTRGRIRCVDSLNPFMGGNKHLDSGMQSCLRHYWDFSSNKVNMIILYSPNKHQQGLYLCLYMLMTCWLHEAMFNLLKKLSQTFKMKDLGELRYFLGIEFARSSKGIIMHQRKYAVALIFETWLGNLKQVVTPIDNNKKLTSKQYDEQFNPESSKDPSADQSVLIGDW